MNTGHHRWSKPWSALIRRPPGQTEPEFVPRLQQVAKLWKCLHLLAFPRSDRYRAVRKCLIHKRLCLKSRSGKACDSLHKRCPSSFDRAQAIQSDLHWYSWSDGKDNQAGLWLRGPKKLQSTVAVDLRLLGLNYLLLVPFRDFSVIADCFDASYCSCSCFERNEL